MAKFVRHEKRLLKLGSGVLVDDQVVSHHESRSAAAQYGGAGCRRLDIDPSASYGAAMATAAHHVLVAIVPFTQVPTLDAAYAATLAGWWRTPGQLEARSRGALAWGERLASGDRAALFP